MASSVFGGLSSCFDIEIQDLLADFHSLSCVYLRPACLLQVVIRLCYRWEPNAIYNQQSWLKQFCQFTRSLRRSFKTYQFSPMGLLSLLFKSYFDMRPLRIYALQHKSERHFLQTPIAQQTYIAPICDKSEMLTNNNSKVAKSDPSLVRIFNVLSPVSTF